MELVVFALFVKVEELVPGAALGVHLVLKHGLEEFSESFFGLFVLSEKIDADGPMVDLLNHFEMGMITFASQLFVPFDAQFNVNAFHTDLLEEDRHATSDL